MRSTFQLWINLLYWEGFLILCKAHFRLCQGMWREAFFFPLSLSCPGSLIWLLFCFWSPVEKDSNFIVQSLGIFFDWFTIIFRVEILLWYVVCLVMPVMQDVFKEEWKTCTFMAWFMNLGCFEHTECDEERWRKLCYVMGKLWQVADLSRRWRIFAKILQI